MFTTALKILRLPRLFCIWFGVLACSAQFVSAQADDLYKDLPGLDDRFQEFSFTFYRAYNHTLKSPKFDDISQLANHVKSLGDNQVVPSIAAISANAGMMQSAYRAAPFPDLLKKLYSYNETSTIRDITQYLNEKGSRLGRSTNYFLLGKYYNERGNWRGVKAALSHVDVKHLRDGDNDYYYLMKGFALQGLKDHRASFDQYKHVPKDSPYYQYAKLNLGTALLKQGWWTDAHMEFNEAIDHKSSAKDEEFNNRMLVVLGYSQLHHQFYRDANKTFTRVSLNSAYVNKALMGMGLAAAYQNEFGTAKNIFTVLAQKTPKDLNADEAQILLPFTHEELGNLEAAAAAYASASAYFEQRLLEIEAAKSKLIAAKNHAIPVTIREIEKNAAELYGANDLTPEYFLTNYTTLLEMNTFAGQLKLGKENQQLLSDYELALKKLVNKNLLRRQSILNSYLSQAKFGVAKLYDK